MLFRYFVVISPWKRILPLIWTNPNFHYSGNFGTIFLKTGFAILKKMMKSFRKTDNRLSDKVTFSFQLRWDKKYSDQNLKTMKRPCWFTSNKNMHFYKPSVDLLHIPTSDIQTFIMQKSHTMYMLDHILKKSNLFNITMSNAPKHQPIG